MELSRYSVPDPYVLEELRREYQAADARGRIHLLQKLQKGDALIPSEILSVAVEDPHAEVRQWVARFGKLYNIEHANEQALAKIRNDPDPFVRACLRENTSVFSRFGFIYDWRKWFDEATHLERLALVRNPGVYEDLIEKIFDPDDTELGINAEQRKELALAFLTNKDAVAKSRRRWQEFGMDGWGWYRNTSHFQKLWELASKWPPESRVPYGIYRYVGTEDKTKAQIYQACTNPHLRCAILENSDASEDRETIKLGMQDADKTCKYVALAKVRYLDSDALEALLRTEDSVTLSALTNNKWLSVEQLRKVAARLHEFGDIVGDEGWWEAHKRIDELDEERMAGESDEPESPEQGDDLEPEVGMLRKKVERIRKGLLTLENAVRKEIRETSTANWQATYQLFLAAASVAALILAFLVIGRWGGIGVVVFLVLLLLGGFWLEKLERKARALLEKEERS